MESPPSFDPILVVLFDEHNILGRADLDAIILAQKGRFCIEKFLLNGVTL
jgi:hypothetical protein